MTQAKKALERCAAEMVMFFGADEIFEELAVKFRQESYQTNPPLSDKLFSAASIALKAAEQVRENWKRFEP